MCRLEPRHIDFIIARIPRKDTKYNGCWVTLYQLLERRPLGYSLPPRGFARPSFTVNDANDDDLPFSKFLSRLWPPTPPIARRKLRYVKQSTEIFFTREGNLLVEGYAWYSLFQISSSSFDPPCVWLTTAIYICTYISFYLSIGQRFVNGKWMRRSRRRLIFDDRDSMKAGDNEIPAIRFYNRFAPRRNRWTWIARYNVSFLMVNFFWIDWSLTCFEFNKNEFIPVIDSFLGGKKSIDYWAPSILIFQKKVLSRFIKGVLRGTHRFVVSFSLLNIFIRPYLYVLFYFIAKTMRRAKLQREIIYLLFMKTERVIE